MSYFFNKMIVLHKKGAEVRAGSYDGWFKNNNYKEENKKLIICNNEDEIMQNLNVF
jgi:hypothetical protein